MFCETGHRLKKKNKTAREKKETSHSGEQK